MHPSVWKGNSAKFAGTAFYEVRSCKARGYSHRPNTTNATLTTAAATNAARSVATNTNGILPCLGQIFECVEVLDDDAAILELDRPALFELAERAGYGHPPATDHGG